MEGRSVLFKSNFLFTTEWRGVEVASSSQSLFKSSSRDSCDGSQPSGGNWERPLSDAERRR